MKRKKMLTLIVLTSFIFACGHNENDKNSSNFNKQPEEGVLFINGKILTLNSKNEIVSSMKIKDNKIVYLGNEVKNSNIKVIDLKGKTVIPGLIDSHIHFVRQGNMPGHVVLGAERTKNIQEFLMLLKKEALTLSSDEIITVMGGVVAEQFEENRLPTIEELNDAIPNHPVYIQQGFSGPAIVNIVGLDFFNSKGLEIQSNGVIPMGKDCNKAFSIISLTNNIDNKKASLKKIMTYANSLGLTMVHDEGGVNFPGGGYFDHINDYDALTSLWKEHKLTLKYRIQHVVYDKTDDDGDLEAKINHTWQGFGDDMLKYTGVGEHIVSFPMDGKISPAYEGKAEKAAKDGWPHEQHSVSYDENIQHIESIKRIHEKYPVSGLRWSLAHVFELGGPEETKIMIEDIKNMSMGLKLQNHGYVSKTDRFPLGKTFKSENAGPLYRTLLDSGLPLGAGTDGCLVVPLNPWLSIYYMVTGKDVSGETVNPNQTISRIDALKLYTIGSAWFSFDDEKTGSLELGKLADFVVLDRDILSIPDEEIKKVRAVSTYVNGLNVFEE